LTKGELLRSRNLTESVEHRSNLGLEREDNPLDNAVSGEILIRYRYADVCPDLRKIY
jgi:hypothetical protein